MHRIVNILTGTYRVLLNRRFASYKTEDLLLKLFYFKFYYI